MAGTLLLSEAEKTFIVHGVQDNLRIDGRQCSDYRHINIETDVISSASGSARLRLGKTDILVGIKADLVDTHHESRNKGRLEFFVDLSANAAPEFEGRGGNELASDISSTLARSYSSPSCERVLETLCVIPKEKSWVLYIDILVLECGGNLYDAASIAVKAALYSAKIPVINVVSKDSGKPELELSDDPYDCKRIDISHFPLIVSLSKIGDSHVVDACMEEETCAFASLMVAVTTAGTIGTMKKSCHGSLHPESVFEMMETGKQVGVKLNHALMKILKREERQRKEQGSEGTARGFL